MIEDSLSKINSGEGSLMVLTRLNMGEPGASSATLPHSRLFLSIADATTLSYRVPSRRGVDLRRVAEGPIHLRAGTVLPHEWQIQISLIYMWRAALRIRLIHQYMQQRQCRKWRRPSRRSMNKLQVLFQLTYRFAGTQHGCLRLRTILLRRCSRKTTQTWFSQEQAFL